MALTQFRQLRVYEAAVLLRQRVFEVSRGWPQEERYALTDQIRRSSRSVGANIAEVWNKRRYERHFVSKLSDAHAEAAETGVWLDVACECGYLDPVVSSELRDLASKVEGSLVRMMQAPHQWSGPAPLTRESEAPYVVD